MYKLSLHEILECTIEELRELILLKGLASPKKVNKLNRRKLIKLIMKSNSSLA